MGPVIFAISIVVGYCLCWYSRERQRKYAFKIAKKIKAEAEKRTTEKKCVIIEEILEELQKKQQYFISLKQESKDKNKERQKQIVTAEEQIHSHRKKIHGLSDVLNTNKAQCSVLRKLTKERQEKYLQLSNQHKEGLLKITNEDEQKIRNEKQALFKNSLVQDYQIYLGHRQEYYTLYCNNLATRVLDLIIQRSELSHWEISHPNTITCENTEILKEFIANDTFLELFCTKLGVALALHGENHIIINDSDGYNREVARRVLLEIMEDGLNDKLIIAEIINKISINLEKETLKQVKDICERFNTGKFHPELLKLIGRLKYRTSFGQNVLCHSSEVAGVASRLAAELCLDIQSSCRAGLLHDVGKSIDHEKEGGHSEIGSEILTKYAESKEVIEGVVQHHEDIRPDTHYATIICTADAISAARPGARRETYEKYITRLEKLESIASSIAGIKEAYAIYAGREIRVIVDPEQISDEQTSIIAKEIVKIIERELQYPGTIKVTVIRETLTVQYV